MNSAPHHTTEPAPDQASPRRFSAMQRVVLLILFAAFACIAWRLWDQNMLTSDGVIQMVGSHPVLAPFVFMAIYALAMLFVLPTLALNIGAGFLWGAEFGAVYALLGSTLGAMLAFVFARTAFGQPFARGFDSKLMQRLSADLDKSPWKVVAFVRLNPAVPTSIVNFLLGLTSLRLWTYAWGTFVFSAPLCYVFSYLGQSTGGFVLNGGTGRLVRIVAVSLGFALFLAAGKRMLGNGKAVEKPNDEPLRPEGPSD